MKSVDGETRFQELVCTAGRPAPHFLRPVLRRTPRSNGPCCFRRSRGMPRCAGLSAGGRTMGRGRRAARQFLAVLDFTEDCRLQFLEIAHGEVA